MTLTSEIIRDAYRESNLIAISADPTADEQDEGLRLLNRLISFYYGTKAGEQLDPILIGKNHINRPQGYPWYDQVPDDTNWFVPPNSRLVLNLTMPQTVYLTPNPDDGARFAMIDVSGNLDTYPITVMGNGRNIAGATSQTLNTPGDVKVYFYRADTGNWALVSPLLSTDPFPFPNEWEDLFVTALAMRLNPRHAVEMDQQTLQTYRDSLGQFKARYRQHMNVGSELGLVFTPGVKRRYFDNSALAQSLFSSGYAFPFGYRMW